MNKSKEMQEADFFQKNKDRQFVMRNNDYFVHECVEHPVSIWGAEKEYPCMRQWKLYEEEA